MPQPRISVAVNVHQESLKQMEACLTRIAQNLADSKRAVFINGGDRWDVRMLAERLDFSVFTGENLGTNRTWHLWWLRMLHFFDETAADFCFKFDPDTMVDRTPMQFPDADYFGDIYRSFYDFPFVQGGITGLSIRAVRRVLTQRLLEYGPKKKWFILRLSPAASLADDQLLSLVLENLGILPVSWPECRSLWKVAVPNDPISYSIVHPRYYD